MREALGEFEVAGPVTNLGFLCRRVQKPDFVGAAFDSGLIERHRADLLPPSAPAGEEAVALATLATLLQLDEGAHRPGDAFSPWSRADGWRANLDGGHLLVFDENGHRHTVLARRLSEGFEFEFADRQRQGKRYRPAGDRLTGQLDAAPVSGSVVRLGNR